MIRPYKQDNTWGDPAANTPPRRHPREWQFSLAQMLMLTTLVVLLLASFAKLGTRGMDFFLDLWRRTLGDGHFELAWGFGAAGLFLAPVSAIVITLYMTSTRSRSIFLGLIPLSIAGFPVLMALNISGWRNVFPNYAPYCVVLMFVGSLFAAVESHWKRTPRTRLFLAILGLATSFTCYCMLVAIRSVPP